MCLHPWLGSILHHHGRRERVQSHPAHLHNHPTNSHPLSPSHPCRHPPHHSGSIQHSYHPTHYNPQYLPTTHIPHHNFTSTFPTLVHHPIPPTHSHPTNLDVLTPSPTSSLTPPFPPSGNPSHWTVTLGKPIPTNTLKFTSPTSPCTLPKTLSSAKPSHGGNADPPHQILQ